MVTHHPWARRFESWIGRSNPKTFFFRRGSSLWWHHHSCCEPLCPSLLQVIPMPINSHFKSIYWEPAISHHDHIPNDHHGLKVHIPDPDFQPNSHLSWPDIPQNHHMYQHDSCVGCTRSLYWWPNSKVMACVELTWHAAPLMVSHTLSLCRQVSHHIVLMYYPF